MGTFQRSNWTRTASSEHARVYAPNAIAAGNVTGNGGQTTVTIVVPWAFSGNGQCEATFPCTFSNANINTGLSLGSTQLLPPTGTSYATGSHPRIQVPLINATNGNLNLQQTVDLVCVQY
jgi:amino acid transporter